MKTKLITRVIASGCKPRGNPCLRIYNETAVFFLDCFAPRCAGTRNDGEKNNHGTRNDAGEK